MEIFIYNIGIRLYYLGIRIASLWSDRAKKWIEGRRQTHYKLYTFVESNHAPRIWVHCASLGEFEQARPLIERIRREQPQYKIILSFFSPSGYEPRRGYEGADHVCYLPRDTDFDAEKWVRRMKPDLVIWVKYDYWYHYLHQLKLQGVPVILISAIYRDDQPFFKWYGSVHRRILRFFSKIFVQDADSIQKLKSIEVESTIAQDTRFDRVMDIMNQRKAFDNVALFKGSHKVFIAGSTWTRDVDLLCHLINSRVLGEDMRYIIAPHDVERAHIKYITDSLKVKKVLFSRLVERNATDYEVLVIDSTGILSQLYAYGDMAYIGGGFDAGIHNILEPIVYGMPVIFGPKYYKSGEAKYLLTHLDWQVAHSISNGDELLQTIQSLMNEDGRNLQTAIEKSKAYIYTNVGGTDVIYQYLIAQGWIK